MDTEILNHRTEKLIRAKKLALASNRPGMHWEHWSVERETPWGDGFLRFQERQGRENAYFLAGRVMCAGELCGLSNDRSNGFGPTWTVPTTF